MKFKHFFQAVLASALILMGATRARAQTEVSYRAVFTWEVPRDLAAQIDHFALRVDDEPVFSDVPNQETDDTRLTLLLDNSASQYQLIFEYTFAVGAHQWQIVGIDETNAAIFTTNPANFNVEASSLTAATSLANAIIGLLADSGRLLVSVLVEAGSVIFLLLFGLFFILDFVLSRGASLVTRAQNHPRRSGFVFDTTTNRGVPFALISVTGQDQQGETIIKTSVSDVDGFYNGIAVPRGEYTLAVSRQGYAFPSQRSRAVVVPVDDFYRGEPIRVLREEQLLDPMIPMDRLNPTTQTGNPRRWWRLELWQRWQGLRRLQPYFELVLFVLSLIGLFVHPSLLYIITGIFYGALVLHRLWLRLRRSPLTGRVVDNHGAPIAGAIVEIYRELDDQHQEVIAVSDDQGRFGVRLAPGEYQARAKKNGYVAANQARTVNADQTLTVTGQPQHLTLKLTKVPKLTEDFFYDNQPPRKKPKQRPNRSEGVV